MTMDSIINTVSISEIDLTDDTFRITTAECDSLLVNSVRQLGVISPPVLTAGPDGFRIVSGFRRILACIKSDGQTLSARLIPPSSSFLKCAEIAIAENRCHRPLNIIEQARSSRLLLSQDLSESALAETARRAGLDGNLEHWTLLAGLCDMPAVVQQGILSGNIGLQMAKDLAKLPQPFTEELARLFSGLGLSLNRQRDLVKWLREIGAREDRLPIDVLKEPAVLQLLADSDLDRHRKVRALMHYLKRRRYPSITAAEEQFNDRLRRIKLPDHFSLTPPKGFEGDTYSLQIRFQTAHDLKACVADLDRFALHDLLDELLNLPYIESGSD